MLFYSESYYVLRIFYGTLLEYGIFHMFYVYKFYLIFLM